MRRGIVMAIAVATLFAVATPGSAETIQQRDQHEENRIEKGERKGQLTPMETQRLENQQKIIDEERSQAAEDGKVTRRERKDIRHDQKRLSRDIRRKRHNERHE